MNMADRGVPLVLAGLFIALLFGLAPVLSECGACSGHVDYTVPHVENIFHGDAIVRGRALKPDRSGDGVEHLVVEDVILQSGHPTAELVEPGVLELDVYDDPCSVRTGLILADDEELIVVLYWRSDADEFRDAGWYEDRTLVEEPDGSLRFLDEGYELNPRIEDILPANTLGGLIEEVSSG